MIDRIAAALGFEGTVVPDVLIAGERIAAVVQLDRQEVARRQQVGFQRPLTDRWALQAVGSLPIGFPVAWDSIDPVLAAMLDALPAGVVESDSEVVIRRFRPAVQLIGALVVGGDPEASLRSVSWMAPDAPRGIAVDRSLCDPTLVDRAESLGIGLVMTGGSDLRCVLQPSRKYLVPSGPRRWRNAEVVYEAWLKSPRARPIPQSPVAP